MSPENDRHDGLAAVTEPSGGAILKGRRRLSILWPLLLAALGFAALPLDMPIARWFQAEKEPPHWLALCEAYAYGSSVALILITLFLLDVRRRPYLPRVVAMSLGAGLLADILKKTVIARTRPYAAHLGGTVFDTFGSWLPLSIKESSQQGFPSAHSATAFGLTAALVWLYPRGRWWFPVLLVLAMLQRIVNHSHFLSDTLWGAAAGSLCAALFLPGGYLSCGFDRLEHYLTARMRLPPM